MNLAQVLHPEHSEALTAGIVFGLLATPRPEPPARLLAVLLAVLAAALLHAH